MGFLRCYHPAIILRCCPGLPSQVALGPFSVASPRPRSPSCRNTFALHPGAWVILPHTATQPRQTHPVPGWLVSLHPYSSLPHLRSSPWVPAPLSRPYLCRSTVPPGSGVLAGPPPLQAMWAHSHFRSWPPGIFPSKLTYRASSIWHTARTPSSHLHLLLGCLRCLPSPSTQVIPSFSPI